jgi:hypothetical protein
MARRWWRAGLVVVGGAAVLLVGAVGALFGSSHNTLADFDGFTRRHPTGSPLDALLGDEFVDETGLALVSGALSLDADAMRGDRPGPALRALVATAPAPRQPWHLHLMWMHQPPFGRVMFDADVVDGRLEAVRVGSLD